MPHVGHSFEQSHIYSDAVQFQLRNVIMRGLSAEYYQENFSLTYAGKRLKLH